MKTLIAVLVLVGSLPVIAHSETPNCLKEVRKNHHTAVSANRARDLLTRPAGLLLSYSKETEEKAIACSNKNPVLVDKNGDVVLPGDPGSKNPNRAAIIKKKVGEECWDFYYPIYQLRISDEKLEKDCENEFEAMKTKLTKCQKQLNSNYQAPSDTSSSENTQVGQ